MSELLIDAAWCRERRACYGDTRLDKLFDRPMTLMEVLTRQDGPWADVPPEDRLWVFTRKDATSHRTHRLFACDCAERALMRAREPSEASWAAVKVSRRFAKGQATADELKAAAWAAWGAEAAEARAEARAEWAAWAAARAEAAEARAAWAAAAWAAEAAASASDERAAQLSDAIRLLDEADAPIAYPIEVQRREMLTVIAKLVRALEWAESYARPNCPDLLKMEMPAAIIAGRKVLGKWPEGATAAE